MRRALALLAGLGLLVALVPSVAAAPPGVTKTADLFAGQTTDVGDVFVWNDATNLYVEIVIAAGWCMTESHTAVASTVAGIPQTRTGNPIPGKFAYGFSYDPCAEGDIFTVPLSGFDATPVIAVHAKVWDESSLVSVTAVSDTTVDFVYGPASTYLAPGNASWGSSVPAVEPSFAAAGVWPTVAGAKWISTELIETTDPVPDSWRWHRTTMTIPAGSLPVSGSVTTVTSDNAERVWYNGAVIGTDGEVDVPYIDNQEWKTLLGYSFTPVVGANTLDFVWRNYGTCSTTTAFCTAPGLQLTPTQNPNGLIYKASVSYYARSESAWAGTAVGVSPFSGANWATYFTYGVQKYVFGDTVTATPYGTVDLDFEVWGGPPVLGTTSWVRTVANANWWEGPVVVANWPTSTTASFTVRVASGTPAGIDGCDITIGVTEGGPSVGTWNITSVVSSPSEICPFAGQIQGPYTIASGSIDVFWP